MSLLRKCPVCNDEFTFKKKFEYQRSLVDKDKKANANTMHCKNCNTSLKVNNPWFKYFYFFIVTYPVVLLVGQLNITNEILSMSLIFILIIGLLIIYDLVEHPFNKYILDKRARN